MVSDSSEEIQRDLKVLKGLNPCCNGIWSLTVIEYKDGYSGVVLILVVMEYGL